MRSVSQKPAEYKLQITVNGNFISTILISRHYIAKHGHYMNDALILSLVESLDGGTFPLDSVSASISYYAADIIHETPLGKKRIYRLIWIFEGEKLEVLGVINAYRRKMKRK